MDTNKFEKQVQKKLKKLSMDDILFFSWLCAVRILPLLEIDITSHNGQNENFYKTKQQQRLISILRAVDIAAIARVKADIETALDIHSAVASIKDKSSVVYVVTLASKASTSIGSTATAANNATRLAAATHFAAQSFGINMSSVIF